MSRKRRESKKSKAGGSSGGTAVIESQPDRSVDPARPAASPLTTAQWESLREKILQDQRTAPPRDLFGESVDGGSIYRWGLATALDAGCDDATKWLSRLAAGVSEKGFRIGKAGAVERAARFQESLPGGRGDLRDAAHAVIWAAAMPGLLRYLPEQDWWGLLGTLQEFRERELHRETTGSLALMAVAEMGLTLSWNLRSLPSCRRLKTSSLAMLRRWCDVENMAVSEALARPDHVRLVLASVWRTRRLLDAVDPIGKQAKKKKRKTQQAMRQTLDEVQSELATWTAAMTRSGGQHAFSGLAAADVRDDASSKGLLLQTAAIGHESLLPAMKAALGDKSTRGRLAWQISLPESLMNDEHAALACLLPEWDVRRGRIVLAYDEPQMRMEMVAGKQAVISGVCETHLQVDGKTCQPCGDWVTTCEYTDDDTHYLELEQPYEGNVVLQRQVMVLREDRCCLFADAVIENPDQAAPQPHPKSLAESNGDAHRNGSGQRNGNPHRKIRYQTRFPLGSSTVTIAESETTELWLADDRSRPTPRAGAPAGARALAIALGANEWRGALSTTRLETTDDHHLLVQAGGEDQLFVPLWFDLSRSRFKSPRTWRQLTVGESLAPVPARHAAAYRIQLGRWQWVLYRSLAESGPRTFFGKQMIADFYCARFDAEMQTYEDLITVEGDPS